jgi:hypothetical protein
MPAMIEFTLPLPRLPPVNGRATGQSWLRRRVRRTPCSWRCGGRDPRGRRFCGSCEANRLKSSCNSFADGDGSGRCHRRPLMAADALGRLVWPLVAAGQLALTIYVSHILAFHWFGAALRSPEVGGPLGAALAFAVLVASLRRSLLPRGPLEAVLALRPAPAA